MKPPCDRPSVALLACSALNAAEADQTRRHLRQCRACAEYFRELGEICADHQRAARELPTAEVSPGLRRRISAAIETRSRRRWFVEAAWLRRGILGAGVAGLAAVLALVGLRWPSSTPTVAPLDAPPPQYPTVAKSSALTSKPMLMDYRLALSRSPEALNDLLTREAASSPVSAPAPLRAGPASLSSEL